jgi:hypothetical protein
MRGAIKDGGGCSVALRAHDWPFASRCEMLPPSGGEGGLQAYRVPLRQAPYGAESTQSSVFYSRRRPEQHDDDLDHRANSLESHLHRGSRLENAMAESAQRHLQVGDVGMLKADSTFAW